MEWRPLENLFIAHSSKVPNLDMEYLHVINLAVSLKGPVFCFLTLGFMH